jgi:CO/xanthine dehydrogenase FAD-binding subunit
MKNFEYTKASSVDGAIQLSTPESRFLAGGIDLLGEMKEYIVSPRRVIDLKLIPGLDQIDTSATIWRLGANVTIAEIAKNQQINAALPGLAEAALEVGSPQIRNVATLGGIRDAGIIATATCAVSNAAAAPATLEKEKISITVCFPATPVSVRSFQILRLFWRRLTRRLMYDGAIKSSPSRSGNFISMLGAIP